MMTVVRFYKAPLAVRKVVGWRWLVATTHAEPGSPTPGRGGRRKRRAEASALKMALEVLMGRNAYYARRHGIDISALCPGKGPGYRIRRREAKKRRRRKLADDREAARQMVWDWPVPNEIQCDGAGGATQPWCRSTGVPGGWE